MKIYVGPFQWREGISSKTGNIVMPGRFGWRMPVGATQAIDLRGPLGVETPNQLSPAKGLFICPDSVTLASPYVLIASDPLESLNSPRRRLLADMFEVAPTSSTRFVDLLHDLTTGHADLTRAIKCRPRIGNSKGLIRSLIGGQVHKEVEVGIGSPEWAGIKARHQDAYRRIREADAQEFTHSKYLATLVSKYRLTEVQAVDEFIPSDLPKEEPRTPSTTLTESWPTNGSSLSGDLTWTEAAGDWVVLSGHATIDQSGNFDNHYGRAESNLSTDDMRVECDNLYSGGSMYCGPVARFDPGGITNHYRGSCNLSENDYYCTKEVSGTPTDIITSELTGSITPPSTDALVVDGDEIELFQDVNSRGSTTDTDISGYVRAGICQFSQEGGSLEVIDNWQAEDIGVVASRIIRLLMLGVG